MSVSISDDIPSLSLNTTHPSTSLAGNDGGNRGSSPTNMTANMTSPVAQLAPELLAQIFVETTSVVGITDKERVKRLLLITQICRYWRDVATSCTALWSEPIFTIRPRFTDLMLELSRDSPLTIAHGPGKKPLVEELSKAMTEVHRFRSVVIASNRDEDFHTFLARWPSRASILERLCLQSFALGFGGTKQSLPTSFLHGGAPELKTLELQGFQAFIPGWDASPIGANLTKFELNCNAEDQRPLSITSFRDFLAHMPRLQVLQLSYSLPLLDDDLHPTPSSPFMLSELRVLEIVDDAGPINLFWRAVQVPRNAKVQLIILEEQLDVEFFDTFLSSLASTWRTRAQAGVSKVLIDALSEGEPGIKFSFDPSPPNSKKIEYDTSLSFRPDDEKFPHNDFLRCIKKQFDLSPLSRLDVEGLYSRDISKLMWREVFGDLSHLAIASFSGRAPLSRFIQASGVDGDTDPGVPHTNSHHHPFVALQAMNCRWVNFGDKESFPEQRVVSHMISAWTHRPPSYPAINLLVEHCMNFTQANIDALKDKVPGLIVTWDGDERIVQGDAEVDSDDGGYDWRLGGWGCDESDEYDDWFQGVVEDGFSDGYDGFSD